MRAAVVVFYRHLVEMGRCHKNDVGRVRTRGERFSEFSEALKRAIFSDF